MTEEKRTEDVWSINCKGCTPMGWEAIEEAVFGCGIVEFLAEKMDWGEGAVQNKLVLMEDYDPNGWRNITIEMPESFEGKYEGEITAMFDKIDSAIDDNAGTWSFNC